MIQTCTTCFCVPFSSLCSSLCRPECDQCAPVLCCPNVTTLLLACVARATIWPSSLSLCRTVAPRIWPNLGSFGSLLFCHLRWPIEVKLTLCPMLTHVTHVTKICWGIFFHLPSSGIFTRVLNLRVLQFLVVLAWLAWPPPAKHISCRQGPPRLKNQEILPKQDPS